MSDTYTWKIESIDQSTKSMLIAYNYNDVIIRLNLPVSPANEDINNWIDQYAPRNSWTSVDISHIVVGSEGTGDITSYVSSVDSTTSDNIDSVYVDTADAHIAAIVQRVLANMAENTI
jgi:hypothetical protein